MGMDTVKGKGMGMGMDMGMMRLMRTVMGMLPAMQQVMHIGIPLAMAMATITHQFKI